MIRNDRELMAAQGQIAHMHRVLAELRRTASSDEFRIIACSTRSLVERMQRDILDYLEIRRAIQFAERGVIHSPLPIPADR
jgi:hypothetical protein